MCKINMRLHPSLVAIVLLLASCAWAASDVIVFRNHLVHVNVRCQFDNGRTVARTNVGSGETFNITTDSDRERGHCSAIVAFGSNTEFPLYVNPSVRPWYTCKGQCIVELRWGSSTDSNGQYFPAGLYYWNVTARAWDNVYVKLWKPFLDDGP